MGKVTEERATKKLKYILRRADRLFPVCMKEACPNAFRAERRSGVHIACVTISEAPFCLRGAYVRFFFMPAFFSSKGGTPCTSVSSFRQRLGLVADAYHRSHTMPTHQELAGEATLFSKESMVFVQRQKKTKRATEAQN